MSEKDKGNLLAILDSCQKIQKFTKDIRDFNIFCSDHKTFDAVLMNFIVIGEAVARLTNELKETYTRIPWASIKGFRNLIAHDYFGVDVEEVWQIIQNDLTELKKYVEFILKENNLSI